MEAEFIVTAIVPTDDGKEEIRLTPKSGYSPMGLTTAWALKPTHGLNVGESVKVGRF